MQFIERIEPKNKILKWSKCILSMIFPLVICDGRYYNGKLNDKPKTRIIFSAHWKRQDGIPIRSTLEIGVSLFGKNIFLMYHYKHYDFHRHYGKRYSLYQRCYVYFCIWYKYKEVDGFSKDFNK